MISEDELILLLKSSYAGDKSAYRQLLEWLQDHSKNQLRYVLKGYTHFPNELKADIIQDILLSFHQNHHTFDSTRPFLPWINTLIRHKTIDFLRKKDFRVSMSGIDMEFMVNHWTSEDQIHPAETQDSYELLSMLPSKQAEILRLSKIEGHSHKEIGLKFGMSESNVKINIFRALKILKKIVVEKNKE